MKSPCYLSAGELAEVLDIGDAEIAPVARCGICPAVRPGNPGFVFDPGSINALKAKGISFESVYAGGGRWIGRH